MIEAILEMFCFSPLFVVGIFWFLKIWHWSRGSQSFSKQLNECTWGSRTMSSEAFSYYLSFLPKFLFLALQLLWLLRSSLLLRAHGRPVGFIYSQHARRHRARRQVAESTWKKSQETWSGRGLHGPSAETTRLLDRTKSSYWGGV